MGQTRVMTETINRAVRRWLFEAALPFWAEHGLDRLNGGYVEQLRLDGRDAGVDFKRTRVICRQIYVFSHAELLGRKGSIALARDGFEYLTSKAWLGPERGWARLLDREGRVMDATPDLYDIAFVLFALGWFHRVSGDPEALSWSLRTLDFVDAEMRHPNGLGFLSEKPEAGPRKQNPHMHLLEATLINLKASGDARFRALADEIVGLFCRHFYDPATQTLGEYFKDDWSRLSGDLGRTIEPGHQFEWAWILADYQRVTGRDMKDVARGLVAFAEAHGVDAESWVTFNAVRDDGLGLDRGSRTWPNTERIQAAVAMFELEGRDPRRVFEQSGRLLLERYLSHTPRGTWIDHFSADGVPLTDRVPASTLYHVVIAFAEMLRVEEAVARAFPGRV
jgi:N-acylglucosamine 2-epimerase/mannose-6-phosphate isomerase